ncbi:MAG TPA: hypothetical protein VJK51_00855 [Candidatus Nanoarchaeia archaeon]|nr:hypothetical protein [Candidatus Nanoarchaeia archaeon]
MAFYRGYSLLRKHTVPQGSPILFVEMDERTGGGGLGVNYQLSRDSEQIYFSIHIDKRKSLREQIELCIHEVLHIGYEYEVYMNTDYKTPLIEHLQFGAPLKDPIPPEDETLNNKIQAEAEWRMQHNPILVSHLEKIIQATKREQEVRMHKT